MTYRLVLGADRVPCLFQSLVTHHWSVTLPIPAPRTMQRLNKFNPSTSAQYHESQKEEDRIAQAGRSRDRFGEYKGELATVVIG